MSTQSNGEGSVAYRAGAIRIHVVSASNGQPEKGVSLRLIVGAIRLSSSQSIKSPTPPPADVDVQTDDIELIEADALGVLNAPAVAEKQRDDSRASNLDLAGDADLPALCIANIVTDHAGYAKFDLSSLPSAGYELIRRAVEIGNKTGELDVFVEVAGDSRSRTGLLKAAGLFGQPTLIGNLFGLSGNFRSNAPKDEGTLLWELLFQSRKAIAISFRRNGVPEAETVGVVENPDACDYELSPGSFITRRPIATGGDGCEHLTPSSLPLQQFRFYQAVIRERDPQRSTDEGPAGTFRPKGLEFAGNLVLDTAASATSQKADIDSLQTEHEIKWGEVLEFEQTWRSVGHSLGEIKYSLPLAPGEAVRLAMIDWNRSDTISRTDNTESEDSLKHRQTFDRAIGEIVNGKLGERQSGRSELGGVAAGIDGMYKSGESGASGAVRGGYAAGAAHTSGNRDIAGKSNQDIHTDTMQQTSLSRQQFSTVVIQASQAETNTLSTRIVANMNRAHTLTVQYYEVLRHLIVRTEYKRRQTAIYVPYSTFDFNADNARRFRQQLEPVLLDLRRSAGFDALERLASGDEVYLPARNPVITLSPSNLPKATKAADFTVAITASGGTPPYTFKSEGILPVGILLDAATGKLKGKSADVGEVQFTIKAEDSLHFSGSQLYTLQTSEQPQAQAKVTEAFEITIISGPAHNSDTWGEVRVSLELKNPQENVVVFKKAGRGAADEFIGLKQDGQNCSTRANGFTTTIWKEQQVIDLNRVMSMSVFFKPWGDDDGWDLDSIKILAQTPEDESIEIFNHRYDKPYTINIDPSGIIPPWDQTFLRPADIASKAASLNHPKFSGTPRDHTAPGFKDRYRNQGMTVTEGEVKWKPQPATTGGNKTGRGKGDRNAGDDAANGGVPNNQNSQQSLPPSKRTDTVLAALLVNHLNDNRAYYNAAAWAGMDPRERRMRIAPIVGPLLSGIGDRVVAMSGNLMGFIYSDDSLPDELRVKEPATPPPAEESVVTLPTRGVFAEAHLGNCNAAEQRDITRYWAFDELPISLLPNIETLKPGTYGQLQNVTPQPLQPNTLNVINAPNVPDPTGLSEALKVLGTANLFRDMSGLEQVNNILGKLIEAAKPPSLTTGKEGTTGNQGGGTKSGGGGSSGGGGGSTGGSGTNNPKNSGGGGQQSTSQPSTGTQVPPYNLKPTDRYDHGVVDKSLETGNQNTGGPTTPTSIDFTVPGDVPVIKQPNDNACWAAVVTMMRGWRNQDRNPNIAMTIQNLGEPFPKLLADGVNGGNAGQLGRIDKNKLLAAAGLLPDPEALASNMPQFYLDRMKDFGPLWVTVDTKAGGDISPHAKIIYGMVGDGTPDGTRLRIIDPASKTKDRDELKFSDFIREYEELAANTPTGEQLRVQLAHFPDIENKEVGEGAATSDGQMVELTVMARKVSMTLAADESIQLERLPEGNSPFVMKIDRIDGWSAKIEVGDGTKATDMTFPLKHGDHTMPAVVAESIVWDSLKLEDGNSATFDLPLGRAYALAQRVRSGSALEMEEGKTPMFPLKRRLESSATIVFGWAISSNGRVTPLDLSNVQPGSLQKWLDGSGTTLPVTSDKTVVIAVYDLTLCSEDDRFQPNPLPQPGPGNVARFYPLLSIWSSRSLNHAAASMTLLRPIESMMKGSDMDPAITSSLFSDSNTGIRTVWDDLDPELKANPEVLPFKFAGGLVPSTRWSSLFAHYATDVSRADITVVSPSYLFRKNFVARRVRLWPPQPPLEWEATDTVKVARQGSFDNVHIAPVMLYDGKRATMAPICHHDCLHIHWRWGTWHENDYVKGWDGPLPHKKAGAPMIPENQTLKISAEGPKFVYSPSAEKVSAGSWQIFMHHGGGISTTLNLSGEGATLIDLRGDEMPIILGAIDLLRIPRPPFNRFYYHNRMLEPGAGAHDLTRMDEDRFPELESM